MAQTLNNQADPVEVETARTMWEKFTRLIKYSSIAAAIVLLALLMAVY